MATSTSALQSVNTTQTYTLNPTSSSTSVDSFAQQLATEIEDLLGQSAAGSGIQIDIQSPQGQNSANGQLVVTLTNLASGNTNGTASSSESAAAATSALPADGNDGTTDPSAGQYPDQGGTTTATPAGFSDPQTVPTIASLEAYQNTIDNSPFATMAFLQCQAQQAEASAAAAPWMVDMPGYDGTSNTEATAEIYNDLYPGLVTDISQYAGPNTPQNAPYQDFMPGGAYAPADPPSGGSSAVTPSTSS